MRKIIGTVSFTLGLILLIYTWTPIIVWHFFLKPKLAAKHTAFLSPLVSFPKIDSLLDQDLESLENFQKKDSTKDSNFEFFLTIKKFGIEKAKVATGDNFFTQVAHLPQSAKPGEAGNVFISGHSTLPQFFSPKNYWSIFSKLYLLEIGDEIILEDRNASFKYLVADLLVVKSNDNWVISPPDSFGSYLTLLTCGVGGLSQDRIIIRATLVNTQNLI